MEPAVTTVLAGVPGQLRPWDDLGDLWVMQGFQASRKPVFWLQAELLAAAGNWREHY
ncbi:MULTISPECIES: hypothetical protein [Lactobacillaceae]|uniref:hypothetical protein n=1 Tax=Lactobacillaceae TaxID=33958 RepID=UPI00145727E5|nr:hypothetical protein [Lactobacillus sp. HBUAS51381]NLR08851.1 hypothetical protein [Lactobacillus sp. HBUAS51381]